MIMFGFEGEDQPLCFTLLKQQDESYGDLSFPCIDKSGEYL